jgi:hypothetical protein
VSDESIIRIAAVVAAVALLASPYWQQIAERLSQASDAAKVHRALLGRAAAAALLIAAAWGKIQLPTLPQAAVVPVSVATPSDEMQRLVTPVAACLKSLSQADRALWAQVWQKAGVVVAGDAVTAEVAFTDTRSLRSFTALSLDIAWRRIGRHQPGEIPGLRDAVEASYNAVLGREVVPVDATVRQRYEELVQAIAWAGVNGG